MMLFCFWESSRVFVPGGLFFLVWMGRDGGRDERSVCQRGGCMVVPGAVVSPGHSSV